MLEDFFSGRSSLCAVCLDPVTPTHLSPFYCCRLYGCPRLASLAPPLLALPRRFCRLLCCPAAPLPRPLCCPLMHVATIYKALTILSMPLSDLSL